jgi:NAD(P)-dependent dehydrogenase (short-subunit alcohol dehydrogenase family)
VSAPDHAAHGEAGPRAKTVPAIALVTGGARRIGATICRALCASGYAVAIHCNASLDQAETLACELRQSGGRAVALAADLADADATAALIDRATAALGPVSVLVNNAATFRYDTAGSFTVADFEYHVRPNLRAPVMLVRDFARALGTRPGAVINMLDHKVTALNPDFFTGAVDPVRAVIERASRGSRWWGEPAGAGTGCGVRSSPVARPVAPCRIRSAMKHAAPWTAQL